MKPVQYIRKGKVVSAPNGDVISTHTSINKAKKKSREIQLTEDGALGRGTLRVDL